MHRDLTLPSIVLGLMGIAPQLAMLAVFEVSPDTSATVKQLSALYATIILSFRRSLVDVGTSGSTPNMGPISAGGTA
jgi:hypothetical protein